MASIYRKYRPQTFAEMVGQNNIKLILQNELESGNFVHAYLFCGPRGLGKTTLARLLAKAVNCETRRNGESEPCNKCDACQDITLGKSMDVIEIDAASHTGVDNVRENIIENVRFAPSKRKYKVFIIDEVHMLSISAFNALLKTLEEPPAHTVFILCTTEIHKVPETIISRCQRFDLKKVPTEEMIKRLQRITTAEKIKIDKEVFEIIAGKSEGCMRDAESLLGQVLSLGNKKITLDDIKTILPSSEVGMVLQLLSLIIADKPGEAIDYINQLVEDGVDLEVFGKEFIELLRKLILIKSGTRKAEWFDLPTKVIKQVGEILEYVDMNRLAQITRAMLQALVEIKNSPIMQLPFELVVIQLCQSSNQPVAGSFNMSRGNTKNTKSTESTESTETFPPISSVKNSQTVKGDYSKSEKQEMTSKIDLEEIKKKWTKIVAVSHGKGTDLMFINEKMVWPVEVRGNKLVVGFKYDLHKCRFETNGNSDLFAGVVKEVSNQNVGIEAKALKPSEVVEFEMAEENQTVQDLHLSGVKVTEDNILDQVLESFGGEVVQD